MRNGETIDVITGEEQNITFVFTGLKPKGGSFLVGAAEEGELKCSAQLVDIDKKDLWSQVMDENALGTLCPSNTNTKENSKKEKEWETKLLFTIPDKYEDQYLDLTLLLTETKGRYNAYSPIDARFSLRFAAKNPIEERGLTAKYTTEKEVSLSCVDGKDCEYFFIQKIGKNDKCTWTPNHDIIAARTEAAKEGDTLWDATTEHGQGHLEFSFPENSHIYDEYLCYYAVERDGTFYKKKSKNPLMVDTIPPRVDANFKPLEMVTEVSCSDSESQCSPAIGYHYISRPVDFIGALFSGIKETRWCPQERSAYSFVSTGEIPFFSVQDFQVLCVWADDYAGNHDIDVLLTYNSFKVLQAIASDQLANGGIDSGYMGYLVGR